MNPTLRAFDLRVLGKRLAALVFGGAVGWLLATEVVILPDLGPAPRLALGGALFLATLVVVPRVLGCGGSSDCGDSSDCGCC